MACFLVPITEAVATTVVKADLEKSAAADDDPTQTKCRLELVQEISWLANLLQGGVVLLAFKHLQHNRVVPWFPFLIAATDPGDTTQMLHGISTVGATMTVLVTVVWGRVVTATNAIRRRPYTEVQVGDSPETTLKEGKDTTLLITVIAATIAIAVWYVHTPQSQMRVGMLVWMYRGAATMWFVDAILEYVGDPRGYFAPRPTEIFNDTYLGLSVLALDGIIWIVTLLVAGPRGVVTKTMNVLTETKLMKNMISADRTPAATPQA